MTIKGYIPGDYLMSCDRCGLTFRRSQIRRDGNIKGLMVCASCWDFKATYPSPPPDRIAVPVPRPDNTTVSANNITWNYTSIGDNLFPDPWMSDNLIDYPNDYTEWALYDTYGAVSVDGSGNFTVSTNGAVVFYYKDVEGDSDTYYSFGGDFVVTQGEATIGILTGDNTVIGKELFSTSGFYDTSAEVEPSKISGSPKDMRFVVTNESATDLIISCSGMYGNIGQKLVDTETLWSGGELSQDHVQYYSHSRKIDNTSAQVSVTGLTVGTQYRLLSGLWMQDKSITVDIDGNQVDIFERPQLQNWITDTYIFTADSDSIDLTFTTTGTAYIDGVYLQEYVNEDRFLTNGEILENKTPPADVSIDNTITPSPNFILWGSTNYFPDPDISASEDPNWSKSVSGTATVTTSRSTEQFNSGTHSRKTEYAVGAFENGSIYIEADGLIDGGTYLLGYYGYPLVSCTTEFIDIGGTFLYPSTKTIDQWNNYQVLFNYSDYGVNTVSFGVSGPYTGTIYYDTISIIKYINSTTPF